MTKPSDYPPVEEMSIKALKKLISRLEVEEASKEYNEFKALKDRQKEIVKESMLPDDFLKSKHPTQSFLINEKYPSKAIQQAEGTWDVGISQRDAQLIFLQAFYPHIIAMIVICLVAIYDF